MTENRTSLKKICNRDNSLQKKVIHRQISEKEFREKVKSIHKEYSETINEKDLLKKLVKKNKPIIDNPITLKEYDRIFRW